MFLRTALVCGAAAVAALVGAQGALAGPPAPPAPGPFANLQPGVASAGLNERVKVNVVFIGFGSGQIDTSAFLADLPERSKPIVRSRLFYGETEELGIDYGYDYATTFTSPTWNTSFFTALKGLAKPPLAPSSRTPTTSRTARARSATTTSSTRRASRSG